MDGIRLHHTSDVVQVLFLNLILTSCSLTTRNDTVIQYISKAHDDIQWRTYLMRQVLYEDRLLSDSLFYQPHIVNPLLIPLLDLFSSFTNLAYIVMECLLHRSKAVLKLTNVIILVGKWNLLVIITVGDMLRVAQKLVDGMDSLSDNPVTQP